MTLSPREASELLRRHGLAPRQRLGQNFVVDPNTVRRIARLAEVGPGDHVVEIGAGLGSLTLALLETGARVTAIELDDGPRRGAPRDRAGGRDRGRRRPPARLGRAAGRPAGGGRGQPSVLRGDLDRRRPAGRRAPGRAAPRHGAGRGRRAAGGRAGHEGLRRGERQGGVLGRGRGRRPRAAVGVPPPAEGRLRARRHPPAPRARRTAVGPARGALPPRARRLRAAPEDAAPVTHRPRHRGRLRRGRHRPGARAEQLDVDAWGRLALAVHERGAAPR